MNQIFSNYLHLCEDGPSEYLKIIELSKSILITVPSSRQNVFDQFESILKYILSENLKSNQDGICDTLLVEMESLIISLISISFQWRNYIFKWALKFLANVSQDYSGEIKPYSLETSFLYWTSHSPTNSVLSIISQTIQKCGPNESIIDSSKFLLKNFSIHSEWLVAFIGFIFPSNILEMLLNIGLKQFVNSSNNQENGISLNCIIKIVDYLSNQHLDIITEKLKMILLAEHDEKIKAYVPKYFLHLLSNSEKLNSSISCVFINNVDSSLVNSYMEVILKYKNLFSQYANCHSSIVKLLINSNNNAYGILTKICTFAEDDNKINKHWNKGCTQIMNNLLIELHLRLNGRKQTNEVPLLKNLKNNYRNLCEDILLSEKSQKQTWLLQLSIMVGKLSDLEFISDFLLCLFLRIADLDQMALLIAYYKDLCQNDNLIENFINKLFKNMEFGDLILTIKKLLILLKLDDSDTSNQLLSTNIKISLLNNMDVICSLLFTEDLQVQQLCLKILMIFNFPINYDFNKLLSVAFTLTDYFYFVLKSDADQVISLSLCVSCIQILEKLSFVDLTIQSAIVRSLLENAILKNDNTNFFQKKFESLIDENNRYKTVLSSSIMFHSGSFNNSQKLKNDNISNEKSLSTHYQLIIYAIWTCSSSYPNHILSNKSNLFNKPSPDMTKLICGTLVELVSPDLMYTGLQWPSEEYIKVTIERDLHVRNQFEKKPILWDLLDLISIIPSGLLQCSCLIRSLLATQMNHWEIGRFAKSSDSPSYLTATTRLLEIINKAQMLPEPLCYTSCLLSHITPYEVFLLLLNIWRYMKIFMNSPNQKPINITPIFTDIYHLVIQKYISKLGHLYTLFIKP